MRTIMEMANETLERMEPDAYCREPYWSATDDELKAFEKLVREEATAEANAKANASWTLMCEKMVAIEREACARKTEEFARKWWKVHCDSNLHYSSTLKAHQDFCALQAAIRARGQA